MRATRSPLPPGHRECRRCDALVPDADAVCFCPACRDTLEQAATMVERARQARQRRLAATGADRYLTPTEASGILAVTPRHVRRLIERGRLPCRRIEHRLWVRESSGRALIRDTGDGPTAA